MKPFRFTLEPLRVVRERQERQAMEKYGQALLELNRRKTAVAEIDREVQWVQTETKRRLVEGALTAYVVQQQLCLNHLESCRKTAEAAVAAGEEKVKEGMQAMLVARQEREIVDKFLAKQRAIYDRALNQEEQKMLDELAGRRMDSTLNWKACGYV